MRPVMLLVLLALALSACGKSGGAATTKQDTAKAQVCSARDDIAKQVDTLKGLTLSADSLATVQTSLKAIDNDLKKIKDASGDLASDSKSQLQQANQAFVTKVNSIVSSMLKTTSAGQAKEQADAALQQLGDAYKQTFAKFDCS